MRNTTLLLNFTRVMERLEENEKGKGNECIFVLKGILRISTRSIYVLKNFIKRMDAFIISYFRKIDKFIFNILLLS